jgi:hypothetical protein
LYLQGLENEAEQQRLKFRTVDDLTDDQLMAIARGDLKMQLYKKSTPDGEDGK